MDRTVLIDVGLCVAVAVFFSFCRTLADNRDTQVRGWALFWLIAVNCAMGIAGGLITVPLAEIMHFQDRAWRIIGASLIGWVGLAKTMKEIEERAKGKFPNANTQNLGSPDSGSSTGSPDAVQENSEPTP